MVMNHLELRDAQHVYKNKTERLRRASGAIWFNSQLFERSV